jgi:hypothetical protein
MNINKTYVNTYNRISELGKQTVMSYKKRMAMYRMLEKMTGEPAVLQINEAIDVNLTPKTGQKNCET